MIVSLPPARAPDWGPIELGKPRQVRIQVSGGIADVEALIQEIKDAMDDGLNDTSWALSFEEVKRFGEVGPLHKGTLGFVQNEPMDT